MKYWDKDKQIRQMSWTKVNLPKNLDDVGKIGPKMWCYQQSSTGKFYVHYKTDTWWFELSEDAIMFKLKWL